MPRKITLSDGAEISSNMYNLIIGLVIVYGVLLNVVMVKFVTPYVLGMNMLVFLIGYIICVFAGVYIYDSSDNPLISFLGYNLIVVPIGVVLCVCLNSIDSEIILEAFILTTLITILMMLVSSMCPKVFLSMGKTLFVVLIGLIVAMLFCIMFGINTSILSWISAGLFTLYIGYDWVSAQQLQKTIDNAIDSAANIYVDIVNLFIDLIDILGDD